MCRVAQQEDPPCAGPPVLNGAERVEVTLGSIRGRRSRPTDAEGEAAKLPINPLGDAIFKKIARPAAGYFFGCVSRVAIDSNPGSIRGQQSWPTDAAGEAA